MTNFVDISKFNKIPSDSISFNPPDTSTQENLKLEVQVSQNQKVELREVVKKVVVGSNVTSGNNLIAFIDGAMANLNGRMMASKTDLSSEVRSLNNSINLITRVYVVDSVVVDIDGKATCSLITNSYNFESHPSINGIGLRDGDIVIEANKSFYSASLSQEGWVITPIANPILYRYKAPVASDGIIAMGGGSLEPISGTGCTPLVALDSIVNSPQYVPIAMTISDTSKKFANGQTYTGDTLQVTFNSLSNRFNEELTRFTFKDGAKVTLHIGSLIDNNGYTSLGSGVIMGRLNYTENNDFSYSSGGSKAWSFNLHDYTAFLWS